MQSSFTPKDLIRHLYHETSPEEAAIIEQALEANPELKAEMRQLREAKLALDNDGRDRPHHTTLAHILAYSSEKSLQETH